MTRLRIAKGDRLRLKVRLASGWKGYGIAKEHYGIASPSTVIAFYREGHDPEETCLALRGQLVRCRPPAESESVCPGCNATVRDVPLSS